MEPAYWAVIPAQVRYAADIPAGAKILYAEISSLTDARGYCFASNAYFQDLYGVNERTVQRYLNALKNGGFIRIQDGDGGSGRRKIYAGVNPLFDDPDKIDGVVPNPDKNDGGTPTFLSPNPDNFVAANMNNKKENKKDNIPPISPRAKKPPMPAELMQRVLDYVGVDVELRDALIAFAEKRRAMKKPIDTDRTLTLLLNKLDRLSGGNRRMKLALIDQAIERNWQSFFPLKDDELPAAPGGAGRSVEDRPEVAQW